MDIPDWLWMFALASVFLFVPILYVGVNWETLAVWFGGIVGAKWLLFGMVDFLDSTATGERLVAWTQGENA